MKIQKFIRKILMLLVFLFIANSLKAQGEHEVFLDWIGINGSQNFFYKNTVKTDGTNVYLAGATLNGSNNSDILVAKYDTDGELIWIQQYNGNGNGNDMATGLYIDGNSNVYITGTIVTDTSIDAVIIKYDSDGAQQWLTTYDGDGNGNDSGSDIVVDGNGDVYITGSCYNTNGNYDVITNKYNSSGALQWSNPFDYSMNDAGVKIGLDVMGNAVVSGIVQNNITSYVYGVLKYNCGTGNMVSATISGSFSTGVEQINDMVQDSSGNIYLAGAIPVSGQGYNYDIIKLNSNLGLAWERNYNGGSSLDDFATGIKVDASGNVYVSGYSSTNTEGKNIITLKYNSSGTLQWSRTYNDTLNKDDKAYAMAMDVSGNIYITGSVSTESDSTDYFTMKYDAGGNLIWAINRDGTAHLNDRSTNIAIDNMGSIIITGLSETAPNVYQYGTVKYVERQVITPTDFNGENPLSSFSYYSNFGQIINTADSAVKDIKFYTINSSPAFYIKDTGYSFVFAHVDAVDSTSDTLHRIDVSFGRTNTTAKTYPMEEKKDYLNYFLPQCPAGITNVHANQRLITTDLYQNIDLMYSSNQNGIKQYFIIKPGGSPTDIQMEYSGATSFYLDSTSNALTINSSIGSITYERPTVYQLDSNNVIDSITGWTADWQTNGTDSIYRFNIGNYDSTKALVIQLDRGHSTFTPLQIGNMDWSTWVGGDKDDIAIDVTTDNDGVYIVGATVSTNFPYNIGTVTNVAQPAFGGYRDAFATKFDNQAQLIWTTYLGGSNSTTNADDAAIGVVHDNSGRICFTGYTWCTDFPTKSSGMHYFQDYLGGDCDAFIVQLNADGGLMWSTYLGGNTRDAAHSILRDNSGNIFICGSVAGYEITYPNYPIVIGDNGCLPPTPPTYNSGFPVCNSNGVSYYHQTHSGGEFDAFIARFNSGGELNWCTFFGGNGRDAARDIIMDPSDNSIYITGYTQSTVVGNNSTTSPCDAPSDNGFPLCELGGSSYYQSTYPSGYQNAFISKFNSQNKLLWSTFFGSEDENFGSHLGLDSQGNLYLTGIAQTQTSYDLPDVYCDVPTNGGFPLCDPGNNAYFRDNDNVDVGWDIFITKFNSQKQITWSTFYGGSGDDYNSIYFQEDANAGITIDNNDYVYITGSSIKISGTTGDIDKYPYLNYYDQDNIGTGATRDAFVAVFNNNNEPIWATYFGGSGNTYNASDIGSALAISNDQKLYLVGATNSTTFPQSCPSAPNPYCQPALANAGSGYYDAFIASFDIYNILGIEDINTQKNDINIFPNPTSGDITLSLDVTTKPSDVFIYIYNNLGQMIYQNKLKDIFGDYHYTFDLSNYSNGLYMLRVNIGDKLFSNKIIKQN